MTNFTLKDLKERNEDLIKAISKGGATIVDLDGNTRFRIVRPGPIESHEDQIENLQQALDEALKEYDTELYHPKHIKADVWLHECPECVMLMETEIITLKTERNQALAGCFKLGEKYDIVSNKIKSLNIMHGNQRESLKKANKALADKNKRIEKLSSMITELIEPAGDCRYDHHGYCQEHTLQMPCPVAEARKLLE